ncbi:MAG TPA: hypothetical protein VGC63_05405 [Solirubrobacterales bacterium]|jgi:hypothetical protein
MPIFFAAATGQFLPGQNRDEAEQDQVADHRFCFKYSNQQQASHGQPNALVDVESDNTFHREENI